LSLLNTPALTQRRAAQQLVAALGHQYLLRQLDAFLAAGGADQGFDAEVMLATSGFLTSMKVTTSP
jgi:hypothetical protein